MKKIIHKIRLVVLYGLSLLLVGGMPLTVFAADATPSGANTTTTVQPTDTSTTASTPSSVTVVDPAQTTTSTPAPTTSTTATSPSGSVQTPADTSTTTQQTSTSPSTTDTSTTATSTVQSQAQTGDAAVTKNTTGGSATTGDAASTATIINDVNSTVNMADNQKAATFVSNVMGDVHGDIVLQPMLLKAMLEANAANPAGSQTITNTSNLANNVNLSATSGNASVTSNTAAGNATTGTATTVANVMNIINSMVSANRSFIGTINIYGNLNGDILIAPDFIPQLLASNSASDSIKPSGSATITNTDNQSVVNNISLAAQSGLAAVTDNTKAGTATTGDASTNVVIFNLSGHEIVASNSLLVFVNVLGKWVGVIVDAPTGATAAAIGNGVTANNVTPDLVVTTTNNAQVTNNITLASRSGDATVTHNTNAGNATSGNASAIANVANITGSEFGISDWFGVLFINVFGTWFGSFGVDTSYGTVEVPHPTGGRGGTTSTSAGDPPQIMAFIPRETTSLRKPLAPLATFYLPSTGDNQSDTSSQQQQPSVGTLASSDDNNDSGTPMPPHAPSIDLRFPILVGATFLIGLSGIGLRWLILSRKSGVVA